MTRRVCTLACIVIAGLLTLVVAGCGGSKDPGAQAILDKTFGANSAAVKSGNLNLAVNANVKGLPNLSGPIRLGLEGPFESAAQKGGLPGFDFTLSLTSGGSTLTAGAVSTGDKGFLKFQGQAFAVTDQLFKQFKDGYTAAQKSSAGKDKNTTTLSSLGVDPRRWLINPRKLGTQAIGGTESFHVAAGIDVSKLLADLDTVLAKARTAAPGASSRITPAQQKKILDQVTGAKVDVWSGKKDERLRRLVLDVKLKTGTIRVALELDNLGEKVQIAAPANARPLSELVKAVQGGSGAPGAPGAPGGQVPAAPTVPPPTATPSAPSGAAGDPKYLACVQKAGQDIAKLQACAKLLSGG